MELMLSEIQQITLRDVLTTAGLSVRQIEDIFLLLSFKRERVQLAFYYRAQGMTFEQVGCNISVTARGAKWLVDESNEIKQYLLRDSLQKP